MKSQNSNIQHETLMTSHAERLQFVNAISPDYRGNGTCKGCQKQVAKTDLRNHLGVYCQQCFDSIIKPECAA